MRVPMSWLAEQADVPAGHGAAEVASALWRVGLEEEAVHGSGVSGPIVVGRVLDLVAEPQKNGKTIRWCQVDVGGRSEDGGPRGIVCGASNFAVDDLVVVALPGAVLPGGFEIAARKTYGHVSDGMICSARELDLGEDHSGILVLATIGLGADEGAVPGADAVPLLGLDEQVLEINVTPDRGYCFSIRGVAREYAHATRGGFRDPAAVDVPEPNDDGFPVLLEDGEPLRGRDGCDRYVARVVRGVDATAPTPWWMQRRLRRAGMRSISLPVDATNYVMLATGQPLHAFDRAALTGPIVVRRAQAGERLTTLDDVERMLHAEDLVITDAGREVLAIAGVMGGATSEVGSQTRDILVESAHFDAVTVARSARRHKLSTEASRRYERGVDPELAPYAAELVVRILLRYGGGQADPGVTDVGERPEIEPIALPADLPSRLVGLDYPTPVVTAALEAVGATVRPAVEAVAGPGSASGGRHAAGAGVLEVRPPSWRPDLRIPVDLVEEVARLEGYEHIPSRLPVAPPGRGLTKAQRIRRSVSRTLAEQGCVEVLSYPFVSPGVHDDFGLAADDPRRRALVLANPLSDEQPELRTSLLATLLPVLRRNVARGLRDLGVFELGLVTRPEAETKPMPQLGVEHRPQRRRGRLAGGGRPAAAGPAGLRADRSPRTRRLVGCRSPRRLGRRRRARAGGRPRGRCRDGRRCGHGSCALAPGPLRRPATAGRPVDRPCRRAAPAGPGATRAAGSQLCGGARSRPAHRCGPGRGARGAARDLSARPAGRRPRRRRTRRGR